MLYKECSKCKKVKPFSMFSKSKGHKFGLQTKCKECQKQYHKVWREKNKEYKKQYDKEWREKNKEYKKQYDKEWEENNKEHRKQYKKEWEKNNPEKVSEYVKKWKEKNPEKISEYKKKYRAKKQGADGSHTKDEWKAKQKQYNYLCLCCGEYTFLTVDHIIPLSKGGSDYIENIQPLCPYCNSSKYTKDIDYRNHWLQNFALS